MGLLAKLSDLFSPSNASALSGEPPAVEKLTPGSVVSAYYHVQLDDLGVQVDFNSSELPTDDAPTEQARRELRRIVPRNGPCVVRAFDDGYNGIVFAAAFAFKADTSLDEKLELCNNLNRRWNPLGFCMSLDARAVEIRDLLDLDRYRDNYTERDIKESGGNSPEYLTYDIGAIEGRFICVFDLLTNDLPNSPLAGPIEPPRKAAARPPRKSTAR